MLNAAEDQSRVVCFGEVLLRMSAPAGETLLQSPRVEVNVGGAEANTAVSLARWGHRAAVVGRLPEGPLGEAAHGELRRHGVEISGLETGPGRMGLYFLTPGAVLRPSEVLYDRADSAFVRAEPGSYDWDALLEGAAWLHLSGVTPATGPGPARAAVDAVKAARRLGVRVSFDGNYRAKLWAAWSGDGPAVLRELLAHADLAFVDERDLQLVLGAMFAQSDLRQRRRASARAAFEAFPQLGRIAATIREQDGVDRQRLSALMFTAEGEETEAGPYELSGVVDRIGAGDAFAAGVLHGLITGEPPLAFGLAAGVLKHSVAGDFNRVSLDQVRGLMAGGGLDVQR
jgi:2-dehydro-3-deoxygluconokinase